MIYRSSNILIHKKKWFIIILKEKVKILNAFASADLKLIRVEFWRQNKYFSWMVKNYKILQVFEFFRSPMCLTDFERFFRSNEDHKFTPKFWINSWFYCKFKSELIFDMLRNKKTTLHKHFFRENHFQNTKTIRDLKVVKKMAKSHIR